MSRAGWHMAAPHPQFPGARGIGDEWHVRCQTKGCWDLVATVVMTPTPSDQSPAQWVRTTFTVGFLIYCKFPSLVAALGDMALSSPTCPGCGAAINMMERVRL